MHTSTAQPILTARQSRRSAWRSTMRMVLYPALAVMLFASIALHPRVHETYYYLRWQNTTAHEPKAKTAYFAALMARRLPFARAEKYTHQRVFELLRTDQLEPLLPLLHSRLRGLTKAAMNKALADEDAVVRLGAFRVAENQYWGRYSDFADDAFNAKGYRAVLHLPDAALFYQVTQDEKGILVVSIENLSQCSLIVNTRLSLASFTYAEPSGAVALVSIRRGVAYCPVMPSPPTSGPVSCDDGLRVLQPGAKTTCQVSEPEERIEKLPAGAVLTIEDKRTDRTFTVTLP